MAHSILVTGANRGIGLELSRQYVRDGWKVFACCRNPQGAEELNRLAESHGGLLTVHRLDVADTGQMQQLAGELQAESIDILFNNAGTGEPDMQVFGRIDEKAWIEAFKVNTVGPFKMAEVFVENVARSERKIIATMSSFMGSIADNTTGGYYVYRSTKTAVNSVMKSLSVDLKHRGIIVAVFHPGWVKTEIGGPHAPLSPRESVAGLRKVLSSLSLSDSGRFLTYEGVELPW